MAGSSNHNDRDELAATLKLILQNQQTFQTSLSTITTELQQLKTRVGPPGWFPSEICPNDDHDSTTTMKLDIPRFDGSDPLGWIFKITQFFDIHLTPEDQRLPIASFYMQEGEALTWFQWMHSNGQLLSWPSFLHAFEIRFAAPSQYYDDDPKGALFKLCQTSSVKEYQAEFETLANRIVGLPPPFYLSCFISGLKSEIRREVQAISPLSQAINLAKLQEQKLNGRPRDPTPHSKPTEAEATTSASPTHNNHAGFFNCNWCG